jgi:drug/metabolite transporter (DMT)-like permease
MACVAAGMVLFFVGEQEVSATAPDPKLGNLLAAGAGVTWALTIVGLRWLGRSSDSVRDRSAAAVAAGNLLAFAVALPLALPVGSSRPSDWPLVVFLGVFQIGVAYVFMTRGMRRVSALETSLLILLEPVLNPVWAFMVHGERPSGWAVVGGLIIIAATAANTLVRGRRTESNINNQTSKI